VPSESDLRDLLRGSEPEGRAAIDLDAVLTRARRRRRPRVVAAQALGSVALAGVLVTAVVVALPRTADSAATIAADTAAGSEEGAPYVGDADLRKEGDVCGEPVVEHPAVDGLALDLTLPTTVEPDPRALPVVVTLRNTGTESLVGTTATAPEVTVAEEGQVLWHTPASADAGFRALDLAPGESVDYPVTIAVVVCTSEADLATDGSASTLPAAGPGDYELRAVLEVALADGRLVTVASAPLPAQVLG